MIADRIIQFERMRLTVHATPKPGAHHTWQSKYFDPDYGLTDDARIEAATLVAKKARASLLSS